MFNWLLYWLKDLVPEIIFNDAPDTQLIVNEDKKEERAKEIKSLLPSKKYSVDELSEMNKSQLADLAANEFGIKIDRRKSAKSIIEIILDLQK